MEQDKVSKVSDAGKNVKPDYKPSYGERWDKVRPTKMIVFWILLAGIILTVIAGFNWGGWVTGGTAETMVNDAVAQRLSSICVGQFNQDPQKDQKLTELKDASPFQRDDYVTEQGWATMPGEAKPDSKVADGCAILIVQNGQ